MSYEFLKGTITGRLDTMILFAVNDQERVNLGNLKADFEAMCAELDPPAGDEAAEPPQEVDTPAEPPEDELKIPENYDGCADIGEAINLLLETSGKSANWLMKNAKIPSGTWCAFRAGQPITKRTAAGKKLKSVYGIPERLWLSQRIKNEKLRMKNGGETLSDKERDKNTDWIAERKKLNRKNLDIATGRNS
jgi:hypothetical protein